MKIGTRTRERIALCAAMVCLLAPLGQARRTVKEKKQAAMVQFDLAERLRGALARKPESRRTRADYEKVIDAYRRVYHTAPNSIKADTAILTVAELLDEQGRLLHAPKRYSDAIGQLVFLRREYPGSKYRVAALFTIGEIYRDDLKDPVEAKATFEDYVKHYPNSSLAPQARDAVELLGEAEKRDPFKKKTPRPIPEVTAKAAWGELTPPQRGESADPDQAPAAVSAETATSASSRRKKQQAAEAQAPATEPGNAENQDPDATVAAPQPIDAALDKLETPSQPHRTARMTGVRHWSTPDYTRVAIDLEQEVAYQAGRVPHPDRIFFDLHDTRVSSELIGKSFDVGSGFLHRIRVSQYKANMARIVLDVDDVAEYSAFLLPNPYRLIIDIHGKMPAAQMASGDHRTLAPAAHDTESTGSMKVEAEATKSSDNTATAPDVTVTHMAQTADSKPREGPVAAAMDRGEKHPGSSLNNHEKSSEAKPRNSSAGENTAAPAAARKSGSASKEKEVQVAGTEPKKIVVDDLPLDESAASTTKPTTGPTFQAVATPEASRTAKKGSASSGRAATSTVTASRTAEPTASGERSLIRALGLKIGKIVIDAGHGGHDTGTIGPNGLMEKDLVLDVALKLGKLLQNKLGAQVVYTRDDDTFIPLETRTAIANKEQADLFISIHANSSGDPMARGVETYYLNFTTSRDALETAARENAVSEKSIHELQDLVKKIALKEKIEESRELAGDVQKSLYTGLSTKSPAIHNRGVKKAPFIVLIGANMPSILAEISFVSNPTDEKKLKTNEYRQRVAESLYKGVRRYVNSLSGVRVAAKAEDTEHTQGSGAMAAK